jgi:hypothetical protein
MRFTHRRNGNPVTPEGLIVDDTGREGWLTTGRCSTAAGLIAVAIAVFAWFVGWRGSDLSAQLFRVALFRKYGMTLWNPQWYGGHFTLSYSILYPPVAATLGLAVSTALSAGGAAWCFARLAWGWFGAKARAGTLLFAVGTGSQIAIGQLPFLMGEAFALAACLAASRRRWLLGMAFAASASLTSPLVGAFLLLVIVTWSISGHSDRRRMVLLAVAALMPMGATSLLFPGTGTFPYPSHDARLELAMVALLIVAVPRRHRALRAGGIVYLAAMAASYFVSSPVGGNISRLGESVALPLATCVLWPARRARFALIVIPMLLWQWTPAWPAITSQGEQPSTHAGYYEPLMAFFAAQPSPPTRVEVVPTKGHYEVAYVAPSLSLARGWERQVDTAENPLFYRAGALDAASLRSWLLDTGAQYVALPDAPLDFAAVDEGRLVREGVPGLTPVWRNEHWRVFAVDGSTGVVEGPAVLKDVTGDEVDLLVTAAGTIRLRFRYNRNWTVEPEPACFGPDGSGWIIFGASEPGLYRLHVGLDRPDLHQCDANR